MKDKHPEKKNENGRQNTDHAGDIETKSRITEIAMQLMDEKGWENVSIRNLCERANISTGAFYYYFASKDEVLTRPSSQTDYVAYKIFSSVDKSMPVLDQFVDAFAKMAEWQATKGPETTKYSLLVHIRRPELNIISTERLFYKLTYMTVKTAQESGALSSEFDTEEINKTLHDMYTGIWVTWCTSGGDYDLKKRVAVEMRRLLECFLPPQQLG
ncbi:TetR/AcrR family transcriptional regulator [Christensenellaceae bacterium OttesenSCG-928-K19]|nr:TetR/AcrR family transcriptional regulator [Christensenellaceae bacterium OttesenSCG-928-K19]